jgi:pimeloyl-ACP methyl ester carboxylesterase
MRTKFSNKKRIQPGSLKRYIAEVKGGIQYVDEGKGQPVLFIHGALSNADTWRKIIPLISKECRCIAIDLPIGGHYLPVADHVCLTPTGIAELIREFIEYLELDNVTIVSNDTGGAYTQVFASLFPGKINKLIFSNCEVLDIFPPSKFKYLTFAVKIPGFNFILSRVFMFKKILKSELIMGLLSFKITTDELYYLYLHNFIQDKSIRANFASAARAWSPVYTLAAAEKLKNFTNPVLILWGNKDVELFPLKMGEALKGVFPDAVLVEIDQARTYIQEDQPEQTAKSILRFIAQ